tara:strand:- start:3053 stop:3559 length:507 start_codon:yes stop_codon:yes gene_type:complete
MADFKIIENWLPKDIFDKVQSDIVWNPEFPVTLSNRVVREEEKESNWYATHLFYDMDIPCSHYWTVIDEFFLGKFRQMNICRSFIRAKLNFYPNTGDMIEHPQHIDYDFEHTAAIFSLNTCNGFTRLDDGTKIDSVANRIFFFNGSTMHNSTTCTDEPARFNINFNFL